MTPHRSTEDPQGQEVIGYLVLVGDTAILRVASSGFKCIIKGDADELNTYAQTVIELMKWATALNDVEPVHLRLSDDPTRKGRLAVELGRMDRFIQRLHTRLFFGGKEYDQEGFGKLQAQFENTSSEANRTTLVTNTTKGLFAGAKQGNLPMSEANLPPYLCHRADPDAAGFDPRVRDGSHLVTDWNVAVFPALAEYLKAFARGASPVELAGILCAHKVPTPRQLEPRNGRSRYSAVRDTTFGQLPDEVAAVRASRWLTYASIPVKAIAAEADSDLRADLERHNELALRKLEALRDGKFLYVYGNPTPTQDAYGEHLVERRGPLDPGTLQHEVQLTWPPKHETVLCDGVRVVTDVLERDAEGHTIPWDHAGVSVEDLDACIARLRDRACTGPVTPAPTGGWTRILVIPRWTQIDSESGEARQWEMWKKGQRNNHGTFHYRWLLWRPADGDDPTANLSLGWKAQHDDASRKGGTERWPGRHVATIREPILLRWVYEALRDALLTSLDDNAVLNSHDLGDRGGNVEDRRRDLLAAAQAAAKNATETRNTSSGYEDTAMEARGRGDLVEFERLNDRVAEKRREAEQWTQKAAALNEEAEACDVEDEAELGLRTVAELLEVMRRSAEDHEGDAPAAVANFIGGLFSDWCFTPTESGVAVSCTAHVPLLDGRLVDLHLEGTLPDSSYGRWGRERYADGVLRELLAGESLDSIVVRGTRSTSRDALYRSARDALKEVGIATYKMQALLDHPFSSALPAVHSALTGQRATVQDWTSGFERHMGATYTEGAWGKSACPTFRMNEFHRVMAVVRQRPDGINIDEIARAAEVDRKTIVDMIRPRAGRNGHRQRPRMLRWAEGKTGRVVQAIPCPHDDCSAPMGKRWATDANLLPETAPEAGGIGGVLCPACSRLPRTDLADVVFPEDWHTPVARRVEGVRGSLRTQTLTTRVVVGTVARVGTTLRLSVKDLATEFELRPGAVIDVLDTARVDVQFRGRGRGHRTYSAERARAALKAFLANTTADFAGSSDFSSPMSTRGSGVSVGRRVGRDRRAGRLASNAR